MNEIPPTLQLLALLALASYLCAPAIQRLFEPELQRGKQLARRLVDRLQARRDDGDRNANGDQPVVSASPEMTDAGNPRIPLARSSADSSP